MVELRKRPARAAPVEESRPAKKKSTPALKSAATTEAKKPAAFKKKGADAGAKVPVPDEAADAAAEEPATETSEKAVAKEEDGASKTKGSGKAQGDVVELSSFGGQLENHDGEKVTLGELVDASEKGIILFTYPKASTPGCTTQACAFRDGHETLTATGFAIYGLSGDSPKANLNFKTKQSLPYTLLCNPSYSLIGAIGMQQGSDKRTKRGVWAVDKQGTVLLSFAGGPIPTVDRAKQLIDEHK